MRTSGIFYCYARVIKRLVQNFSLSVPAMVIFDSFKSFRARATVATILYI